MVDSRERDRAADPYAPSAATARLRAQIDDAREGAQRSAPRTGSSAEPYVVELRQWRHGDSSAGRNGGGSDGPASAGSPKHSRVRKSNMQPVDPEVLAPRASGRMLQRYRLLDHQTLYRDRIFDESDWSYHSSSWRYILEPKVLLKVLAALILPLCAVLLVSVVCAVYQGLRDEKQPDLRTLDLSFAYSLVSFALSLLLVFKTNTSYSRFWEARSAWGATYTHCRTLMARFQGYAHDAPLPMRKLLLRWIIALPYLMRSHLADYKPGSDSLEHLLTQDEIAWLRGHDKDSPARHQPLLAVSVIIQALCALKLKGPMYQDIMSVLDRFMTSCGICERIQRTPIPMPYSRHTTRFVLIYIVFLPLALWRHLNYYTIGVAPLITFLLAGIENIGVMIENPMRIMPMAAYCATIHGNVMFVGGDWAAGNFASQDMFMQSLAGEPPEWQRGDDVMVMPECEGNIQDPFDNPYSRRLSASFHHRRT